MAIEGASTLYPMNETATPSDLVTRARGLADDLLFPSALATDAADLVPRSHLDALAEAGLYGLAGPRAYGGHDLELPALCEAIEALAGGCLTTAFVWIQHHGVVRAVRDASEALREQWLRALCTGARRAGVAQAGLLPGPPLLTARRADGGWVLDGEAPWVTGWNRIDVLLVAARDTEGEVVRLLVDARNSAELHAEPLRMAALAASGTVRLRFAGLRVPADRLGGTEAHGNWGTPDAGGLRANGSLALGVAARCCTLLGPSALGAQLAAAREALDGATNETIADARAGASELAMRAAAAVLSAHGSRAILLDQHAQRLAREAMFLLVFGQRPAIRERLLERLGARADEA